MCIYVYIYIFSIQPKIFSYIQYIYICHTNQHIHNVTHKKAWTSANENLEFNSKTPRSLITCLFGGLIPVVLPLHPLGWHFPCSFPKTASVPRTSETSPGCIDKATASNSCGDMTEKPMVFYASKMGHVVISGNVPWNMWGKVAIKSFLKNWMDSTRYKRMQVVCRDKSCKCVSGMSFQLTGYSHCPKVQLCKEEKSLLLIFIFEPSFFQPTLFPTCVSSVESFFQRLKFTTTHMEGAMFSSDSNPNLTKVIFKTQQRFVRPHTSRPNRKTRGEPWRKSAIRFGDFPWI